MASPIAYYNEHDPFAAAWLIELISAGLITDGVVDTRDIRDVPPDELYGYTQCHFFAGVGVWSHALRQAGWPDDKPVWTGSCPCQPFSASGRRKGFADERHLWPAWHHLIRVHRPECVFGEQVASKDGLAWFDLVSSDLEGEGYAVGAADTCAAGVGAPHIRQRLYWLADSQNANGRRTVAARDARGRPTEVGGSGAGGGLADSAGGSAKRSGPQCDERAIQDSYWADYEWVETTDGRKFPIKPGLCVLAHGTPARVGRLRGYGNALNAPQAKAFIESYLEVRG